MKNIIIKTLHIQNFLSVGNTPVIINFKDGINVITGINHDIDDSKNGVGKSTIIDALNYAFYNETVRKLKQNEIINNITNKNCLVKCSFDVIINDVSTTYEIIRGISPKKHMLLINGEDKTKSTISKNKDYIIDLLGIPPELFKNSILMSISGTTPFMLQKKVEKRKLCEGLFDLTIFTDMLSETRKQYNKKDSELSIKQNILTEISNNLELYKKQKQEESSSIELRKNELQKRIDDNNIKISEHKKNIITINNDDIITANNNIKLLTKELNKNNIELQNLNRKIAVYENDIKNKENISDVCVLCGSKLENIDINAIKIDIEKLNDGLTKSKNKKNDISLLIDKINKCIDIQNNVIQSNNKILQENNNIKEKINILENINGDIKDDIQCLYKKTNTDELIKSTTKRLSETKRDISILQEEIYVLNSIKFIVSEEGVKSYIIKKLLKIMNSKLKYYLDKLEAPCYMTFDEYFDENITNKLGISCSYNNFSGGEQKRIDLAILFTFMDILKLQCGVSVNITFYDEILDTSLDNKGIECFIDVIKNRITKYNESCYIITHKYNIIDNISNSKLILEKRNGITTLAE